VRAACLTCHPISKLVLHQPNAAVSAEAECVVQVAIKLEEVLCLYTLPIGVNFDAGGGYFLAACPMFGCALGSGSEMGPGGLCMRDDWRGMLPAKQVPSAGSRAAASAEHP